VRSTPADGLRDLARGELLRRHRRFGLLARLSREPLRARLLAPLLVRPPVRPGGRVGRRRRAVGAPGRVVRGRGRGRRGGGGVVGRRLRGRGRGRGRGRRRGPREERVAARGKDVVLERGDVRGEVVEAALGVRVRPEELVAARRGRLALAHGERRVLGEAR
jgi:hypothetical protein